MENYKYRPVKFYLTAFAVTWFFWFEAILFNEGMLGNCRWNSNNRQIKHIVG